MLRQEEAVPILDTFHAWLQKQYACAQPKSSFAKALFYCINNWKELNQYVTSGALAIDNNASEREMKYVAMGRNYAKFANMSGYLNGRGRQQTRNRSECRFQIFLGAEMVLLNLA